MLGKIIAVEFTQLLGKELNGRLDMLRAPDGNGAWNYGNVCGELMSFGMGGGANLSDGSGLCWTKKFIVKWPDSIT